MPTIQTIGRATLAIVLFSVFAMLAILCGILALQFMAQNAAPLAIPMIIGVALCLIVGAVSAYETFAFR